MLAYGLLFFSAVVLLVVRRADRFVQFHSLQSIAVSLLGLGFLAFCWLFSFFPLLGFLYSMLLRVGEVGLFLLWIYLLVQAARGRWVRLPYLGAWAERQIL